MGNFYEFISGSQLENAHSSIVDAKSQTPIVLHKESRCVLTLKHCASYISDVFATKTKKRVTIMEEPERNVHMMWSSDMDANSWLPAKAYNSLGGSQGGYDHGPAAKVLEVASKSGTIVDICLLYSDLDLWSSIAKNTEKYANDEWVVEVKEDKNGVTLKRPYFIACKSNDHNKHHCQNEVSNFKFTTGYFIAWHGNLGFHGAKAEERDSFMVY